MIYITNSDGDPSPCQKVLDSRLRWVFCEDTYTFYQSLLNLISTSSKKFSVFNAYGKVIKIPNDPEEFRVRESVKTFKGLVLKENLGGVVSSQKFRKMVVKRSRNPKFFVLIGDLKHEENAEEILKLGIRIIEPVKLPSLGY